MLVTEVINNAACGFWQSFEESRVLVKSIDRRAVYDFFAIWRYLEALNAVLHIRESFLSATVGIDAENLSGVSLFVMAKEHDFLAVLDPADIGFGTGGFCQPFGVGAVGIHYINFGIPPVFFYIRIGKGENNLFAIGRGNSFGNSSEGFQNFRSETAVDYLDVRLLDDFLFVAAGGVASGQSCDGQHHCAHSEKSFVHYFLSFRYFFVSGLGSVSGRSLLLRLPRLAPADSCALLPYVCGLPAPPG